MIEEISHMTAIVVEENQENAPFCFHQNTAIPYRESTGFLQGIPCVVFPPLHVLAVYRV